MYKMMVIKSKAGVEIFLRWKRAYLAVQSDDPTLAALVEEDRALDAVRDHFHTDGIVTWSRHHGVWHVWMFDYVRPKKYRKGA